MRSLGIVPPKVSYFDVQYSLSVKGVCGMSAKVKSPLDDWRFLIGTWKSKTEGGEFGESGVIEGVAVFSYEPGEDFIMATGENRCEGRLLHRSVSIMFYDNVGKVFRRKTFFSYGFVNNEVECARTKNEITFDVVSEPLPRQFEGTRWRSFMRKISDRQIAMGLSSQGKRRIQKLRRNHTHQDELRML